MTLEYVLGYYDEKDGCMRYFVGFEETGKEMQEPTELNEARTFATRAEAVEFRDTCLSEDWKLYTIVKE